MHWLFDLMWVLFGGGFKKRTRKDRPHTRR